MSISETGLQSLPPATMYRQNALSILLFLCTAFAFLLRFSVSPQLLNLVVHYTSVGGAFIEKLHFGTYAIFLLLPLALFSRKIVLRGDEIGTFKALLLYSALMAVLVPYLFSVGRASSSGFIIDTYVAAGAAGLLMLAQDSGSRRALGNVVLVMLIVSAAIGIVEAVTKHRLLLYNLDELQFRPIGLAAHPLALGAFSATAIGFVMLTHWRIWVRLAAAFILLIGVAASGARFALLMAGVEVLLLLLFVRWPQLSRRQELRAKFVAFIFAVVTGAALVVVLLAGGLLSRFNGSIFDENFFARVTIYRVFEFVSWKQIIFGMNDKDLLDIVHEKLHLPYIESTPVVLILLFGLPVALLFIVLVFWMLLRLLRHAPLQAWIATITFLLAALSNNALSSKTPEMTMIVVLLIAFSSQAKQAERPPSTVPD